MILMNKYEQAMKYIAVTPEMHARVLQRVCESPMLGNNQKIQHINFKKILPMAACVALLIVGAMTVPDWQFAQTEPQNPSVSQTSEGIVPCESLDELSKQVGFSVCEMQQLSFDVQSKNYTSLWGETAQIEYRGKDASATFRMSVGAQDNSGDYQVYENVDTMVVGNLSVTVKGIENRYSLAVWQDDTYSYSVSVTEAVDIDTWIEIINGIQ